MRLASVVVVVALAACAHEHAPKARAAGKVMSITGVAGLIVTAFAVGYLGDRTHPMMVGFSTLSGIGIGTYAAGELGEPAVVQETTTERHHRWARILTERAYGYARDGRCHRVRHIETRVRVYDREFHDFVFMRDSEIQKCLTTRETEPTEPRPSPEPTTPTSPEPPAPLPTTPTPLPEPTTPLPDSKPPDSTP